MVCTFLAKKISEASALMCLHVRRMASVLISNLGTCLGKLLPSLKAGARRYS